MKLNLHFHNRSSAALPKTGRSPPLACLRSTRSRFDVGPVIHGLELIEDFISHSAARELATLIDQSPWQHDPGQRRTQHYGWRYDYSERNLTPAPAIPPYLDAICDLLLRQKVFGSRPDQMIVNNYETNEGIAPHIDHVPSFGPVVASLSLLSPCVMSFRQGSKLGEPNAVLLRPNSLLILREQARYDWYHEILPAPGSLPDGTPVTRSRRISVTFRTVRKVPDPEGLQ